MSSRSAVRVPRGSRSRVLAGRSFSARRPAKDPRGTRDASFRRAVWEYWEEKGRHDLPWRKTYDPYKILVSEMMLQQTQVARVIPKFKEFLEVFPTAQDLAKAPLGKVLHVWSGLGYNRRAKYLHDAANIIVGTYGGDFREALAHPLPGVGPYTKAAVRAFAWNEPAAFVETNIRTALIHHFYSNAPKNRSVADAQLMTLLSKVIGRREARNAREWYWALMDYGTHLKQSGVRNNHRSKHYAKQLTFEGSFRQLRGAILRELHEGQESTEFLRRRLKNPKGVASGIQLALASLSRDGLVTQEKGKWRIS